MSYDYLTQITTNDGSWPHTLVYNTSSTNNEIQDVQFSGLVSHHDQNYVYFVSLSGWNRLHRQVPLQHVYDGYKQSNTSNNFIDWCNINDININYCVKLYVIQSVKAINSDLQLIDFENIRLPIEDNITFTTKKMKVNCRFCQKPICYGKMTFHYGFCKSNPNSRVNKNEKS